MAKLNRISYVPAVVAKNTKNVVAQLQHASAKALILLKCHNWMELWVYRGADILMYAAPFNSKEPIKPYFGGNKGGYKVLFVLCKPNYNPFEERHIRTLIFRTS